MAIIRSNNSIKTREKLAEAGFYGYTGRSVNGRGKLPVDIVRSDGKKMKSGMLPKRLIICVVEDSQVDQVVSIIVETNSMGLQGDGKIFVNPVLRSYTISSGVRID